MTVSNSRQSSKASVERKSRRLPFVDANLLQKVIQSINSGKLGVRIKTYSRNCTIVPEFVGLTFEVHNGRKFIPVLVNEMMVGKKLGEFSPTRFFNGHGSNRKGEK